MLSFLLSLILWNVFLLLTREVLQRKKGKVNDEKWNAMKGEVVIQALLKTSSYYVDNSSSISNFVRSWVEMISKIILEWRYLKYLVLHTTNNEYGHKIDWFMIVR